MRVIDSNTVIPVKSQDKDIYLDDAHIKFLLHYVKGIIIYFYK